MDDRWWGWDGMRFKLTGPDLRTRFLLTVLVFKEVYTKYVITNHTYFSSLNLDHVLGQVPEPEMLELAGLPLFLEMAGIGNAAAPLAMRPFLAWR